MMMSLSSLRTVVPTHVLEDAVRSLSLEAGEQLMRFYLSGKKDDWLRFLSIHEEIQSYENEISERVRILTGVDEGQLEKGVWG